MNELQRRVAEVLGPAANAAFDVKCSPRSHIGTYRIELDRVAGEEKKTQTQRLRTLARQLERQPWIDKAVAVYPNIYLEPQIDFFSRHLETEITSGDFPRVAPQSDSLINVSYFSPNANKPLHLGHARNLALGDAISNLLEAAGQRVVRSTVYSDYGIHIARAAAAYLEQCAHADIDTSCVKGDHLVGRFYVEGSKLADSRSPGAQRFERRVRALLRAYIDGDPEARGVFERLTALAIEGFESTCRRFGSKFDNRFFESDTLGLCNQVVREGLDNGTLEQRPDGSVWLAANGRSPEVILARKDGSPLYMLQRIACTVERHQAYGSQLTHYISVRAEDQASQFSQYVDVMERLGNRYDCNREAVLYGLVRAGDKRLRSRAGDTVTLDETLDDLERMFERDLSDRGLSESPAAPLSVGSLKLYLLSHALRKEIRFDRTDLFEGRGRVFLRLYEMMGRLCEIAGADTARPGKTQARRRLLQKIAWSDTVVTLGARNRDPTVVVTHVRHLCDLAERYFGKAGQYQGNRGEARLLGELMDRILDLLQLPTSRDLFERSGCAGGSVQATSRRSANGQPDS